MRIQLTVTMADECHGVTCASINAVKKTLTWIDHTVWTPGEPAMQTVHVMVEVGEPGEERTLATLTGEQWREIESNGAVDVFVQALVETTSVATALCIASAFAAYGDGTCWPFDRHDSGCGDTMALFLHRELIDVTRGIADCDEARKVAYGTMFSATSQLQQVANSLQSA